MKKDRILYLVDIGLAISFFIIFITGVIKFPGLFQSLGISRRNLPIYEINILHDWIGILMGLLVLIHLALHFRWILAMTKNIFKRKK